jgi:hypothetical protein
MTWKLAAENATVIGQMFDSLTLPLLENLSLTPCRDNPPPVWPPDAFLALADCSAFANHLTRLQIHAIATGDAVLRYLGVLSHLAELVIWDTPGADAVITDTLLRGLIYTSDATGILPNLYFLGLTSHLSILYRWTREDVGGRHCEITLAPPEIIAFDLTTEQRNRRITDSLRFLRSHCGCFYAMLPLRVELFTSTISAHLLPGALLLWCPSSTREYYVFN